METATDQFIAAYDELRSLLSIDGPEWLVPIREQAMRKYQEFGLPTRKDEEFKYTSLRTLSETEFKFGFGANVLREDLTNLAIGTIEAVTVGYVNGQYAPEISSHDRLPKGVFVGPLSELPGELMPTVEKHLTKIATLDGKLGSTNDERFVALNTAYMGDVAVVILEKGVSFNNPIHLHFVTSGESVFSAPRTLVVMGENSEATIIESYGTIEGEAFTCPVTEIHVEKSARLEHVRFQDESVTNVHVSNTFVHQETQSVYTSNNINFGGKIARNDINAYINGEHCETWLNGANVGTGDQVIDNHTRIDHALPNCQSFEVYKSILKDHAEGVFNGKIFVYEDAQKTDAKQTNQAILLSPTATMNTKPQLEIFADDVKCTHGATIGQLREDAMFYLQARGVEKSKAQALLVYAFAAEVIEKIGTESVKDALEARLFAKLA